MNVTPVKLRIGQRAQFWLRLGGWLLGIAATLAAIAAAAFWLGNPAARKSTAEKASQQPALTMRDLTPLPSADFVRTNLAGHPSQIEAYKVFGAPAGPNPLREASALLAKGDAAGARARVDATLAAHPNSAAALGFRAVLHLREGNTGGALLDLAAALEHEPGNAPCRNIRARIFLSQNRPEEALGDLDAALESAPAFLEARKTRAHLRATLRDWSGAIADYDEIVRVQPADAAAIASRGVVRVQLGQNREAEADLRRAGIINPADPAIACNHAAVLYSLDRYDDALATLEPVLKHPQIPAAVSTLEGVLLAAKGDLPKATEALDRALAADPNHAPALRERARVWALRGEPARAAADTAAAERLGAPTRSDPPRP